MPDHLEQFLLQHMPSLNADELKYIRSLATQKKLARKQLLLREGEICRYKSLVISGLMRSYYTTNDGNEYIMKFSAEYNWIVDPDSFNFGTPSKYAIEALEPTELYMWSRDDFERAKASVPALHAFSEEVITKTMSDTQRRLLLSISASAEEKYRDFIHSFPTIMQRVPLHMVASYLGVSRETLTRVRQGMAIATKG